MRHARGGCRLKLAGAQARSRIGLFMAWDARRRRRISAADAPRYGSSVSAVVLALGLGEGERHGIAL
jgi:hypothetical protein